MEYAIFIATCAMLSVFAYQIGKVTAQGEAWRAMLRSMDRWKATEKKGLDFAQREAVINYMDIVRDELAAKQ